jgi:translation initiation factor IF-3
VEIMLRGRENQHADLAFNLLNKFLSEVNAITPAHFETKPERQGNKIFAIILKG